MHLVHGNKKICKMNNALNKQNRITACKTLLNTNIQISFTRQAQEEHKSTDLRLLSHNMHVHRAARCGTLRDSVCVKTISQPFHCWIDSRWSLQRRSLFSWSPGLLRVVLCGLPLEFGMGLQSKVGIRIN